MAASTIEYRRPRLYPEQEQAIFSDARYALIEATTKAGKTVGCIVWIFEQAISGKAGSNYWWVAPVYSQARIAYRRLHDMLPQSIRDISSFNDTEMRVSLPNQTHTWFKSGEKPDNLFGEDVYAGVIDEASRLREESWHAVRTTITATRGPMRIIGNVKGRRNWFYRMSRKAESGTRDMHYAKLTVDDAVRAGVVAQDEVEDARSQLPEAVFREMYYAEPSDDQGNPFGMKAISNQTMPEMPSSEPVCWGWDLAKSVDWTVGYGLDSSGRVCRYERFQSPWEETMAAIGRATGHLPAYVDSTGVGDPIVEQLQRTYGQNFEGYHFSPASKQKLMEGLALAIQSGDIWYPDGVTVSELEAFEYEYTRTGVRYSAPQGMHDDCVCALALAWARFSRPRGDLSSVHVGGGGAVARGGDW